MIYNFLYPLADLFTPLNLFRYLTFRSIAASKNTSLAVVALGIAEALFATAIGLFAAIPALIAYNKMQGDVAKAQARLETFADEFSAILSRQADQQAGERAA